jgi:hypothetical protein
MRNGFFDTDFEVGFAVLDDVAHVARQVAGAGDAEMVFGNAAANGCGETKRTGDNVEDLGAGSPSCSSRGCGFTPGTKASPT